LSAQQASREADQALILQFSKKFTQSGRCSEMCLILVVLILKKLISKYYFRYNICWFCPKLWICCDWQLLL